MDVLSLVSLGAGGVWARGIRIAQNTGKTAMRNVGLFGKPVADGWQGVIMAEDLLDAWDAVNKDPTLSPDERLDKLVQLARNAVLAGTLTAMSFRGTAKDIQALKRGEFDNANLQRLADPKARLTEADAQPARRIAADETEKTLTLQPHPEEPDALVREKVAPETAARDKAGKATTKPRNARLEASIRAKQFRPENFDEIDVRLAERHDEILRQGFHKKFTDEELLYLIDHPELLDSRFIVRIQELDYSGPDGHLGRVDSETKELRAWVTTIDQIEDNDSLLEQIARTLAIELKPGKKYAMLILDTAKISNRESIVQFVANAENLGQMAQTKMASKFTHPDLITEVLKPDRQAEFRTFYKEHVEAGLEDDLWDPEWSKGYLRNQPEMLTRLQAYHNLGANEEYLGTGLTKDITGRNQFGVVEYILYDAKPQSIGELEAQGAVKKYILKD